MYSRSTSARTCILTIVLQRNLKHTACQSDAVLGCVDNLTHAEKAKKFTDHQ